ncbi:hypothetical protein C5D04_00970 [Rathayibacter sp. AY1D2]|nr:hypothetical protein C5D04_00680 [Rathayibacter sp. AY1D2]PPI18711.1 hypothetical protein C5D04_00970 [Rathayibacter sp. AY1D2]
MMLRFLRSARPRQRREAPSTGGCVRRAVRTDHAYWRKLAVPLLLCSVLVGCSLNLGETVPTAGTDLTAEELRTQDLMLWAVERLNAEEDLTTEAVESKSDAGAFDSESTAHLVTMVNSSLRPLGPYTVKSFELRPEGALAVVRNRLGILLDLQITANANGELSSLVVNAAVATASPSIASFAEAADRLEALVPASSLLMQVTRGSHTESVHERAHDILRPVGSVMKLYVLAAVVEAIKEGDFSWEDVLMIDDGKKSLPTGRLHLEPDGTEISVFELSRLMMQISDNTAADVLMDAVGAQRLSAAVRDLGHHQPDLLEPFPTTRKMFQLTLGGDTSLANDWNEASSAARHGILEKLSSQPLTVDPAWIERAPFWPRDIDWFANAEDVASAHRAVVELGRDDPRMSQILRSPEIASSSPFVERGLVTLSEKIGSSPGVVAVTLVAVGSDGAVYSVVALGISEQPGDPLELYRSKFIDVARSALDLLIE